MTAWMAENAASPVRVLCAPPGFGKTTALVGLLTLVEHRKAYVRMRASDTTERLRERVASAMGFGYTPASFSALLAAIAAAAPCTLALDDVDAAAPETIEEIVALCEEVPHGVSLLCAVKSSAALDLRGLHARGLAALMPQELLAFRTDDVAAMCERLSVPFDSTALGNFFERTEGWPIVCAAAVRNAAKAKASLSHAYERWLQDCLPEFRAFVEHEVEASRKSVRRAFFSATGGDVESLFVLVAAGMFVGRSDRGHAFFRPLRDAIAVSSDGAPAAGGEGPKLEVRLFGRFEVTVEGKRVEWLRRRDGELFRFLALQPDGSATRERLLEVFWPAANAYLARQSLRTSASNIRKALSTVVGLGEVESYFAVGPSLALDFSRVAVDARTFAEHVADGDREVQAGRTAQAIERFRAAEALYTNDLLSDDVPEPAALPQRSMYRTMYAHALRALATLYAGSGAERNAREYAGRADALYPALERTHGEPVA
ncbi:MAG: AAA family ATPase [Candidatus Eremiobacteraeota bacterium]|nr:AAA family ATPase [Candidatus Eremiobacteraeota bacterium]